MNLKTTPTRKHINAILNWCVKTYGKSKYNKEFPIVQYKKPDYLTEGAIAFYDDWEGVIFINKLENKNLYDLTNSILHEYTHYKQNPKHYEILSLYLPYSKNPLEIAADEIAIKDTKKCLKELFQIQIK
jgi:hypothetical protein